MLMLACKVSLGLSMFRAAMPTRGSSSSSRNHLTGLEFKSRGKDTKLFAELLEQPSFKFDKVTTHADLTRAQMVALIEKLRKKSKNTMTKTQITEGRTDNDALQEEKLLC